MIMKSLTNYQRLKALQFLIQERAFTIQYQTGRFKLNSPPAYVNGPPQVVYDGKNMFDLIDAATTGENLTEDQFDPFQDQHRKILDGSHK